METSKTRVARSVRLSALAALLAGAGHERLYSEQLLPDLPVLDHERRVHGYRDGLDQRTDPKLHDSLGETSPSILDTEASALVTPRLPAPDETQRCSNPLKVAGSRASAPPLI